LVGYRYRQQLGDWLSHYSGTQKVLQAISNEDFLPAPLRSTSEAKNAHLTRAGVIAETNAQRRLNNNLALHENAKLDQAAELKLNDMFKQQYFEHISPQGTGPSDLAKQTGYQYIVIGENLALGNFQDDHALVDAWMNSPGHRANILNARFQEIGVAVGQGTFEGQRTWLAVQEFGTPLSACPGVSSTEQSAITVNQQKIADLKAQADSIKADFNSGKYDNDRAAYNARVNDYNNVVAQLNHLIVVTKAMVSQYNAEVSAFNKCLEGTP
jgi:uncharacterized protein YkwD